MPEAYIYDHVRTPRGRGKADGALHEVTALALATVPLQALKERNNLGEDIVDDVVLGVVDPVGEAGSDIARFAAMKPGAFLINTARGDVVHEAALVAALLDGTIRGAGLDVYEAEPQVPEALKAMENVVLLPHLGSATRETRSAMGMRVAVNLEDFFAGRPLRDPVV
jgi:hypothetical protein